jgi:hypothetical protein
MSAKIRRAGIDGNVLTAAGLFVLPRFLAMPGNVIFILFRYVTCQHTGSPRLRLGFHGQRSWEQRMMELGKWEMGNGKRERGIHGGALVAEEEEEKIKTHPRSP